MVSIHVTGAAYCNEKDPPERALSEECLRQAFGHLGHEHALFLGGGRA